ncbi:MAG: MtsA protein [Archangium sp.]
MTAHRIVLPLLVLALGCTNADTKADAAVPPSATGVDAGAASKAIVLQIGPRLLSNQTSQPISITLGDGAPKLSAQTKLVLGAPVSKVLDLIVIDDRHAFTRLPAGLELGVMPEVLVDAKLSGIDASTKLRLINDTVFPDLTAFVVTSDAKTALAVSGPTDTVYVVDLVAGTTKSVTVADGPSAIALWKEGKNDWAVVTHLYSAELTLFSLADPQVKKSVPAPVMSAGLIIQGNTAYVAEQARDSVVAIDLVAGKETWRTPVAPNPRELAIAGKSLVVGSLATGALEWLDLATGAPSASHEPKPGTPIVGGTTAKYGAFVMNGKAPRDLAWSSSLKQLFVASIGPNIGPNPDKMEVSMNGGVGVVDATKGWSRHLGFGAGVTESLAIDEARGLIYASDVSLGLIRVLDGKKLIKSDADASKALVQEVALRLPVGFPLVRPEADFNVQGRAGPSLETGPRQIALSADGKTLTVLERFTCMITQLDVAKQGKAEWKKQVKVCDALLPLPNRRLGQILYHADLGRTAMSCDACHIDGHGEGVLFEKTNPLRIYRSTTIRGSRETPPYFTPASTFSMGETMKVVGGRNRFHNPDPSPEEIDALTLYGSLIPTLPNPFVGADGAPVESLLLPDGRTGNPRKGLALFEGKAGCVGCHPAPQYTMDQDAETRGKFIDVGTPHFMPLREEMQNVRFEGFGTPALVGSWDVFPMLTTGLAGLAVKDDGSVRVDTRFPLRTAIEKWAPTHGHADALSDQEKDDLLAWVMSL